MEFRDLVPAIETELGLEKAHVIGLVGDIERSGSVSVQESVKRRRALGEIFN